MEQHYHSFTGLFTQHSAALLPTFANMNTIPELINAIAAFVAAGGTAELPRCYTDGQRQGASQSFRANGRLRRLNNS